MPDPTLPHRLHEHADALRRAAGAVTAATSSTPWRSLAADSMRARAADVGSGLLVAAAAVDDAADALGAAHTQAVDVLATLHEELGEAVTASARATAVGARFVDLALVAAVQRAEVAVDGLV